MKVTHGCLRLYPEDVENLFAATSVGTPVRLVNQAAKAGWLDGRLYLEVHPTFDDSTDDRPASLTPLVNAVLEATDAPPSSEMVDWESIYATARVSNGIPSAVSATSVPVAGASSEVGRVDD